MNQQVKTQWLGALRSGEYDQTRGRLRDYTGFCCLGVLCDLYLKETNNEWEHYPLENAYRLFDESCTLPLEVMAWAGLPETNPIIPCKSDLACINDDGSSFAEIADMIEEQL